MAKQLKGNYWYIFVDLDSRSKVKLHRQTWVHISKPIGPRDFILGTKIQPNKAHLMIQVPMTGQGQMAKNWPKSTKWAISLMLFHLQTSYLVPSYNPIRHIQWHKCRWPWPKVKVKGQGQIFPKWVKNQRTGHISEAISPTDFILGTKVQPNKAHSMAQVSMTLTQGQSQRSRSNFPKNG